MYSKPTQKNYSLALLSHKDSEGQVQEEQIQDAMEVVESLNKEAEPKGRKMKLEMVKLSFASSIHRHG